MRNCEEKGCPGEPGTPGQLFSREDGIVCIARLSLINQIHIIAYERPREANIPYTLDASDDVYFLSQIELMRQINGISFSDRRAILPELFLSIVLKNQKGFDWKQVHVKGVPQTRYKGML